MKKFLFFGSIFLMLSFSLSAQFVFKIPVKDAVTRHAINSQGKLYLVSDTSTVYVSNVYGIKETGGEIEVLLDSKSSNSYMVEIVGSKIIEENGRQRSVESDEYDAEWVMLQRKEGMSSPHVLPPVYLGRRSRNQLKELTVTASKVMFYHKGDTLIYNADAFVTAEGSTLDVLLRQMPGVELQSNGVIYCNGRRVDNLLLNGKDLFNGKNELMLKNLGAYTVKDIAVYDKAGRRNELMGIDTGDKAHVMDVRLKRQYSIGWIVNAEGGYGTHDRYLGKIFGMWFSDNVSMTLFGAANNLSDGSIPESGSGSWSREQMGDGESERQTGGLTYLAKGRDDIWELKGSVDILHLSEKNNNAVSRENFLSDGNTFDYSWRNSRSKSLHVNTSHTAFAKLGSKANLTVTPKFGYRHNDDLGNSVSATFHERIADISQSRIEQIYDAHPDMVSLLLNRDMREWLDRGHAYNGSLTLNSDIRLPRQNMLSFYGFGSYDNTEFDRFNRYMQNIGTDATPVSQEYQYFKNYPDHTLDISLRGGLTKFFTYHMFRLPIWYEFHHRAQTRTSEMSRLDQLTGYSPEDYPLGVLPSMTQMLPLLDLDKSYGSNEQVYDHTIGIAPGHSVLFDINADYGFLAMAGANVKASHRSFNYRHGGGESMIDRTDWLPTAYVYLNFITYNRDKWQYDINFDFNSSSPSMINMVTLPVTDPLNRFLGNENLSPSYYYKAKFVANRTTRKKFKHTIVAEYNAVQNAQARAYFYNTISGERIFKTYNVNGNMDGNVSYEFFFPFGRGKRFNLTTNTRGIYVRSVDLVGSYTDNVSFDTTPPKNIVNSFTAAERLTLNWQIGKHRFTAFGDARVNRYESSDRGFTDFTSWTCNYGASAVLAFPYNWSVSTDMTMYTRRGFLDTRLNTTDLIWNARLSKSILKGQLTFVVDAYDLLHQLNNITYTINAQARTESVRNVIPRYVLFHIQWRFNKQPNKPKI